ncbi:MAG: 3'-5' exonuclease, partial [Fimbriimonadales bacterium]
HSRSETPREIEEERRLCYVGMTRPQDELHLTLTMSRGQYGTRKPSLPSPFLKALGDQPMPTLLQMLYGSTPAIAKMPSSNTPSPARQVQHTIFIPGQRVLHPELGTGIVVRTTDQIVTVMFPGGKGLRTYPLHECPLQEA